MDPITAISLAGTIATFVDFAIKVTDRTREVYSSPCGTSAQVLAAETTTNRIIQNLQLLRSEKALALSRDVDQTLVDMSAECEVVAEDMLRILGKLQNTGKRSPVTAVKLAFRSIASQRQVDELSSRLKNLQSLIQL